MGIIVFLLFLLGIILVAGLIATRYLDGNWLAEYSIIFFLLGWLCIIGSIYFDLPIVSLRYGVRPEIGDPSSGLFVGTGLIGVSIIGMIFYQLILRKKILVTTRINKIEGGALGPCYLFS